MGDLLPRRAVILAVALAAAAFGIVFAVRQATASGTTAVQSPTRLVLDSASQKAPALDPVPTLPAMQVHHAPAPAPATPTPATPAPATPAPATPTPATPAPATPAPATPTPATPAPATPAPAPAPATPAPASSPTIIKG